MISVIGQFFGIDGYSSHTRYLANALNKLTDVKLITNLPPNWQRDVNDQELEMIKREQDFDINLIICNPIHWRVNCSAKRNICYLIWEGDKIPQWMLEECLNPAIEKIICPSTHTQQAVLRTIYETPTIFGDMIPKGMNSELSDIIVPKLIVIPHGVDLKTFHPIELKDDDNTFKFGFNKGLRNLEDRGGGQYLIRAYLEEFTDKDNVKLIFKLNPAYGIPNLLQMFPELKNKGIPKITYIPENYTKKQLNELYNRCDVFVSPTRSEAFNLPVAESAACGKMSIVTGYGGQTDFVEDKKTGFYIDYKLAPVTHECEYEETMWATPSIPHLRKLLRYAFAHQDEVKQKGKKAFETAKSFTWDSTAKQIHSLLK